jgi:adenine phosphoribosyltransferase
MKTPPDLKRHVIDVPDFPQPGILFRDISPLLRRHLHATLDALEALVSADEWEGIDVLGGIESRGFILGAALAERRDKGFVLIRKKGKLPPPVVDVSYELEYGTAILEMQRGGGRLLIIDDVLATGGTLRAAAECSRRAGYDVRGLLVLIDLKLVTDFRWGKLHARSAIQYG